MEDKDDDQWLRNRSGYLFKLSTLEDEHAKGKAYCTAWLDRALNFNHNPKIQPEKDAKSNGKT
jgi:hypothetical protein